MKICISARAPGIDSPVDPRFGRAGVFMVHDTDTASWTAVDNKQNLQAAQGAGIQAASLVVNNGCTVLISGHCGPKAFSALERAGVAVYAAAGGSVAQAVSAWQEGSLKRITTATVEGHW